MPAVPDPRMSVGIVPHRPVPSAVPPYSPFPGAPGAEAEVAVSLGEVLRRALGALAAALVHHLGLTRPRGPAVGLSG